MELKGSKTEANLLAAFSGESQARNKYTYYASTAKKEGIEFSENERDMMINILKQNMSEEERKKTDMILSLMKNMKRR